jgi:hypothetical protein
MDGAVLRFEVDSQPGDWGTAQLPPSPLSYVISLMGFEVALQG